MMNVQKFSDFAEETNMMDGEKVKLKDVENKKIIVLNYRITKSKYRKEDNMDCMTVQFTEPGSEERKIFFTGSSVLIGQMKKYEDKLPFLATVKRVDRFLTFT